ncbi:S-layer family protein [Microcoleus sp. FACHB-SPT15]|uniref:two-partner secretion domain-containing protein n=1 Tax=Microcoleus sp. FACHB-SPT15 TaxID=2692830 RepID=UPI00177B7AB5|nr:S-layer family protein [Microcoleus sp. FACHB-SPT15]MBD1807790.1 S-layer family protein [Microcoleus sp. FACHB-SPT15]
MKPRFPSFWLAHSVCLFWLTTTISTPAQIVGDTTLPNPSIITPNGNTSIITGGTQSGSNLFHSFGEFSVPTGEVASFQEIDQAVENIISRVTGLSVSTIDGLIEVLQANGTVSPANFFLINPNGIIFGSNASLNIGGSFLASTASSLNFADGSQFSATAPQTTPLLTVSVPIGLQFGGTQGNILNQSQARNRLGIPVGLRVQPDKTLALVGGNVSLNSGYLRTPGGRVELGGVAGAGIVGLNVDGDSLSLNFPDDVARADISLSNEAFVDVTSEGGGNVQLSGRRVTLTEGSAIQAYTLGSIPGGTLSINASESVELSGTTADGNFASGLFSFSDFEATGAGSNISVETGRLIVQDGAQILVSTLGAGAAGALTINALESIEVIGTAMNGLPSGLFAGVEEEDATGFGGSLTIETRELIIQDGGRVSTSTFGQGQGGSLIVRATDLVEVSGRSSDRQNSSLLQATVQRGATGDGGSLTIDTGELLVSDGAQVSTSTFGQGDAGDLTVQATQVTLLGYGTSADDKIISSGLLANSEQGATGTGGNLTIDTERLSIQGGAQVSVTTFSEFSQASAGNLTVQAFDVELVGVALSADGQFLTNDTGLSFGSGLFAGTGIGSTADGGTLRVETERLTLRDGAVLQTTTFGAGDAGDLIVQASESVELVGTFADNRFPTSLLALSGGIPGVGGIPEATGQGGDLTLETGELIVRDRALVAVSSLNSSNDAQGAGNLQITTRSITLDNQGELTAETASGDGGNIALTVEDLLLLRRESGISTSAGVVGAGGNGGNITIDTSDGFVVAVPEENSDISANAFTGNGGNIQIQVQAIFGTQFREDLTPESDITASSQFGLDGVVEITTPDVDPSRGLVGLPTDVVDASGLIASGCGTPQIARSEFIVTGRGGLPPTPSETLSSDTIWTDLRPATITTGNRSAEPLITQPADTKPPVEAQGWVINDRGKVVLTAQAAHVLPHRTWQTPIECKKL